MTRMILVAAVPLLFILAAQADNAATHVHEGLRLRKLGKLAEAEREASIAVSIAGSDSAPREVYFSALVLLSSVLSDEFRSKEAEQVGRDALQVAENRPEWLPVALNSLGEVLVVAGKYADAKP